MAYFLDRFCITIKNNSLNKSIIIIPQHLKKKIINCFFFTTDMLYFVEISGTQLLVSLASSSEEKLSLQMIKENQMSRLFKLMSIENFSSK